MDRPDWPPSHEADETAVGQALDDMEFIAGSSKACERFEPGLASQGTTPKREALPEPTRPVHQTVPSAPSTPPNQLRRFKLIPDCLSRRLPRGAYTAVHPPIWITLREVQALHQVDQQRYFYPFTASNALHAQKGTPFVIMDHQAEAWSAFAAICSLIPKRLLVKEVPQERGPLPVGTLQE